MAASLVDKKSGVYYSGWKVQKENYWEALYPKEFSDLYPRSREPPSEPKGWDKSVSLPIIFLSHITHNKEAASIRQNDSFFSFHTRQKVGKSDKLDGSPMGKTFKKVDSNRYVEIPSTSPVFPGYLSWWGINCKKAYETDPAGVKFSQALVKMKSSIDPLYEAGYLKSDTSSKYGNREFVFTLKDLIESYKQSRKDCVKKDVYLRKAGTLRYRYEICYVVMVVMSKDLRYSSIEAMPSMFDEPCFEHNGCINQKGKLLKYSPLRFKVKRPFTMFEEEFLSWESLVFAFYFEEQGQLLQCSKHCGRENEVIHDPDRCLSKQPPPPPFEHKKWVCPNDLHKFMERKKPTHFREYSHDFATSSDSDEDAHFSEHSHDFGTSSDSDEEESSVCSDKPVCQYGARCYKKNPEHLRNYYHPLSGRTRGEGSRSIPKRRTAKATKSLVEGDSDDNGLSNTYDYQDSFTDDEDVSESSSSYEDSEEGDWMTPTGYARKRARIEDGDINELLEDEDDFISYKKMRRT